MFRISNEYGNIPYDGFTMSGRQFPRGEFIRWARQQEGYKWRDPKKNKKGWENFVSVRVNGAAGALKVKWRPMMIGRGMPMAQVYCNPSTAGLSPNETMALLRWVLWDPDGDPVSTLATKLDLEGHHKEIDSSIYYPGLRVKKPNKKFTGTNYHGSVTGSVRPKTYDKGAESDGEPHKVARFEIIEQLKNNSNPQLNLRRPTALELVRGDWVEKNAFRRAMVVDLDAVADPVLAELALKVGLTEALRVGHLPKTGNRGANMGWLRRKVNDNADKDLLFSLYQEQATAWHSQFDLVAVDNLCVVWSEDLGLEIIPRVTVTTGVGDIPA